MNIKDLESLVLENKEEIIEYEGYTIKFNPTMSFEKLSLVSDKISDEAINSGGIYFPSLANVLIFYFLTLNMTDLPLKQGETIDLDFTYNLMISKLGEMLFDKLTATKAYKTLKTTVLLIGVALSATTFKTFSSLVAFKPLTSKM